MQRAQLPTLRLPPKMASSGELEFITANAIICLSAQRHRACERLDSVATASLKKFLVPRWGFYLGTTRIVDPPKLFFFNDTMITAAMPSTSTAPPPPGQTLDASQALAHLKTYEKRDGLSLADLHDGRAGGVTYNDFLVLVSQHLLSYPFQSSAPNIVFGLSLCAVLFLAWSHQFPSQYC